MMSLPVWLPLLESSLSLVPFPSVGISVWVLCPGGPCRKSPQSEKRAVCIPLECFLVTIPKRSLLRLCFYTYLSVILFTGGVSRPRPGGGMGGLPGGVQAQALWGLSGVVCPGPGSGGLQAQAWGAGGCPGPGPGLGGVQVQTQGVYPRMHSGRHPHPTNK